MASVAACGDDLAGPDERLAPLVGTWEARQLVMRNAADTTMAPDLIALGATFTLNVQPSGQYTAILLFQGQTSTELGELALEGQSLVFNRTHPAPPETSVADYFQRGDSLHLDAPSRFDFNLDGNPEDALARIDLVRR